jgi:hypothetical protein
MQHNSRRNHNNTTTTPPVPSSSNTGGDSEHHSDNSSSGNVDNNNDKRSNNNNIGGKRVRISTTSTQEPSSSTNNDSNSISPPPIDATTTTTTAAATAATAPPKKRPYNTNKNEIIHELPYLVRQPTTPRNQEVPYLTHHYIDYLGGEDDPYENFIFWGKLTGHPAWPVKLGTADDLDWVMDRRDEFRVASSVNLVTDYLKSQESDSIVVRYLGTGELGVLKRGNLSQYISGFKENNAKCSTKNFLLALEQADGEAMRHVAPEGMHKCMYCGSDENPETQVICDRCNAEAHVHCIRPPLLTVPEGDWFCILCSREAPITTAIVLPKSRSSSSTGGGGGGRRSNKQLHMASTTTTSGTNTNESGGDGDGNVQVGMGDDFNFNHDDFQPNPRSSSNNNNNSSQTDPNYQKRGFWSPEEDAILIREKSRLGPNWDEIAKHIPGRTNHAAKNRWVTMCKEGEAYIQNRLREAKNADEADLTTASVEFNSRVRRPREGATTTSSSSSSNVGGPTTTISSLLTSNIQPLSTFGLTNNQQTQQQQQQMNNPMKQQLAELINSAIVGTRSLVQDASKACFICGRLGALIACCAANMDGERCGRFYHRFCLGEAAPPVTFDFDSSQGWICPYHRCAVCGDVGISNGVSIQSSPPLIEVQGSCRLLQPTSTTTSTTENSVPTTTTTTTTSSSSSSRPTRSSRNTKTEGNQTTTTTSTESGGVDVLLKAANVSPSSSYALRLAHCSGCPLALCDKHLNTPVTIQTTDSTHKQILETISIRRIPNGRGFFACEYCGGISNETGHEIREIPYASLVRILDRGISRLACESYNLVQGFIHRPPKHIVLELLGQVQGNTWLELYYSNIPLSLHELQNNVRSFKYTSYALLKTDVQKMSSALTELYKSKHPLLADAAISIPNVLDGKLLRYGSQIIAAESRNDLPEIWKKYFIMGSNITNKSTSSTLKQEFTPWVLLGPAFIPLTSEDLQLGEEFDVEKFESLVDVARQPNLPYEKTPTAKVGHDKPESNLLFTSLIRGLEVVKPVDSKRGYNFDSLLGPTKEEVQILFDNHSAHLRAAMTSAGELRKVTNTLMGLLDGDDVALERIRMAASSSSSGNSNLSAMGEIVENNVGSNVNTRRSGSTTTSSTAASISTNNNSSSSKVHTVGISRGEQSPTDLSQKSLMSLLTETRNALEMERKARQQLQLEIEQLKAASMKKE